MPFSAYQQILQEGARKLLQAALENEVIDCIQFHKDRRDERLLHPFFGILLSPSVKKKITQSVPL